MLRITVELIPYGIEERKRTIATATIVNDGGGSPECGNYIAEFDVGEDMRTGRPIHLTSKVQGFWRHKHVWNLISTALKNCIEE